jgi:hypothetical protein
MFLANAYRTNSPITRQLRCLVDGGCVLQRGSRIDGRVKTTRKPAVHQLTFRQASVW